MGAGASAAAGPCSGKPQAAPATSALSDLSQRSGTAVAELLGMTVSELAALVEKQGIRPAALASRAAEMGFEKAELDAAAEAGSKALLGLIQQAAYQETARKRSATAPEPEPEQEPAWLPVKAWMGDDPVIKRALEAVGLTSANPTESELRTRFHPSPLE